jgi:kynurenine formamidase
VLSGTVLKGELLMVTLKGFLLAFAAVVLLVAPATAGVIYESVNNFGPDDEVGAMVWQTPDKVKDAVKLVTRGDIYSLAVYFNRFTPLWPGHPPFEWVNFRTPKGVLRVQKDQSWLFPASEKNEVNMSWTSGLFLGTEHTGTHVDGFAHIMAGPKNAIYNGFEDEKYHGDWGWLKAGMETVPPFFTRGIMIDVAAMKGHKAGTWNKPGCNRGYAPGCQFTPGGQLPDGYLITVKDTEDFLKAHNLEIRKGDVVVFRTGRIGEWYEDEKRPDGKARYGRPEAGPDLETARYLVKKGIIAVGADNVAVEVQPSHTPPRIRTQCTSIR